MADPLILASGSAIRRKMLEQAGIVCSVISPLADEEALKAGITHLSPKEQAQELARAKAESVAKLHPEMLVLGADQVCEFPCHPERSEGSQAKQMAGDPSASPQDDTHLLSKPGTHENAVFQLKQLQGKTHFQHSAASLWKDGQEVWSTVETARLTLRPLSDQEIEDYLLRDKPYGACGSYHYESGGKHLFSNVEGGADVIQGLPLKALLEYLTSHP